MNTARFFVVRHDGAWRVEHKSVYWDGLHKSRQDAVSAAVIAARAAVAAGREARVLVQGENDHWYTEWASDAHDPGFDCGKTGA